MLEGLEKLAFYGFKGDKSLRKSIKTCLQILGITCNYYLDGKNSVYFLHKNPFGYTEMVRLDADALEVVTLTIVEPHVYIEKLKNVCIGIIPPEQWYLLLFEGDQITIAERTANAEDYPYSFTEEMLKYVGQTFTISCIEQGSNIKEFPLYNGDERRYYLCEIGYTWHSSMFVQNIIKVQHIELSDLPLNL